MKSRTLENLKKTQEKFPNRKRFDVAIHGLQLQNFHLGLWSEIKNIVKKDYDINMNRIGPVVTTLVHKNILLAKQITEKIKTDERIREYANECGFPTKSIYYESDDPEKIIDGIIFLMIFRVLMGLNFHYTQKDFTSYITNGVSDEAIKELFSIKGDTIVDTDSYIDVVVQKMLKGMTDR